MPENENVKIRPHPWREPAAPTTTVGRGDEAPSPVPPYAELSVTTNYTFLTGGSHPEEVVYQAAALGYRAVAITDLHSLAGVVRAHVAAKEAGIALAVGARVRLKDPAGLTLNLYPTGMEGYRRLCRLLTLGKRRAEKGECLLTLGDVEAHAGGLLALAIPPANAETPGFWAQTPRLRDAFGDGLAVAARFVYGDDDLDVVERIASLCGVHCVPMVASNDPLYHDSARRPLQDVLTCIRLGCTLDAAGLRLAANAERHLKTPAEMHRLFARWPGAINHAVEMAARASAFSLGELRYEYPDEAVPAGCTPSSHLRALTLAGAADRYPSGVPEKVTGLIGHELTLIDDLRFAPYFLTVHAIVVFARSRGILCQGRGAAANSAVCYCLGVTAVDPARVETLFERFVSKERGEPPDIDIDFEHERREEVIQYLYETYGRDRAALTAEVITYRPRSAVRDVGKALGLSLDLVDRLAKSLEWWDKGEIDAPRLRAMGLDPSDRTVGHLARLTNEIQGFPRHLSQHVGGFVITRSPLCELVPIENAAMPGRTVIEWDKDDIDAVGMMKVDCLGLGMLTAIRKAIDLVNASPVGAPTTPLAFHTIPPEDPAVYDMLCEADSVGVFQVESRAQMSMLPRLRPRCYYDLVIEVAIVRPGPIQGDMVHPYLRRRNGDEPADIHPLMEKALRRTLGVPLFQEQCMALAVDAAGFTAGEADGLRRAIASWKRKENQIAKYGERLIAGMMRNDVPREFAERCFHQIKGFSEYGFPESHAASFALLVYVSSWLKRWHPAAFACALLNSQPMGFYQPAQLVADAQDHGVTVLPVDVARSAWDCTLEAPGAADAPPGPLRPTSPHPAYGAGGPALRLGLRMVAGLGETAGRAVEWAVREGGGPVSVASLYRRAGVPARAIHALAAADAFRSAGIDRRRATWEAQALQDSPMPLFDAAEPVAEDPPTLPAIPPHGQVLRDYAAVGLSLRAHPLSFHRDDLARRGVRPCANLRDPAACPSGSTATIAGIVLLRQRPGTAAGIVFMTIEDETAVANLIVRPEVYERHRAAARHSVYIIARGRVERGAGGVTHLLVREIEALRSPADATPRSRSRNFH